MYRYNVVTMLVHGMDIIVEAFHSIGRILTIKGMAERPVRIGNSQFKDSRLRRSLRVREEASWGTIL